MAMPSPIASPWRISRSGDNLAADLDGRPPRYLACAVDGAVDLPGDPSQVRAGDVRRQADHALHIVAVILAGHGSRIDRGDVAEQERRGTLPLDRDRLDLGQRVQRLVGDLDLHLVADAGLGVGPVVGHNEPAGGRGRDHGASDLGHRDAAQPGFLTVDLHPHGRIIERLDELEIAQRWNTGQLGPDLLGKGPVLHEVGAVDRDLHGGRRAEAHHLADDIGRLEREPHIRQRPRQHAAESLLQILDSRGPPLLQRDPQHHLLGPSRPLEDGVDRIARGNQPDIADGDLHVTCHDLVLDRLQDPKGQLLGLLDPRSRGCAHPDLEPAGVHPGKDLQAEVTAEDDDHQGAEDQVDRHGRPPPADKGGQGALVGGEDAIEQGSPSVTDPCLPAAEQPGGKDRNERARQQVRGDHREPDGQRERNEQSLGCALHEERRQEHRQDAEHGQEPGHRRVHVPPPDGQGDRVGLLHLVVDVLDLDGRLVHQDADRQRQPAQRHQVDRLAGEPKCHQGPGDGQGDVQDHDDRATPVAEEDQHHQSDQSGAQGSFGRQAADGVGHSGRLVELEADPDVLGQHRLHLW